MGIALGIDLGTTNSVGAVATATGVEFILGSRGERVHPSVVALPAQGGILVGTDAKLTKLAEPQHVISSAKRFMGQNFRSGAVKIAMSEVPYAVEEGPNQQPIVVVRDRRMTMPEVSSQILSHLRRCAERQLADKVSHAVITVPANFTDAQRQATKEAGRLAGLEVMRLINEPTAAALAYGFGRDRQETVCVFDFGGGTLDVSLLRIRGEVFEVLASDGDFWLGGDDIDKLVADQLAGDFLRKFNLDPRPHPTIMNKLRMGAEQIKFHLSENAAAEGELDGIALPDGREVSLSFALTRQKFDSMIGNLVQRTMDLAKQALAAASLEPIAVDQILCVGGSTRIPLVRNRLAELFGKQPDTRFNPDEVVAQGAAIQAGSLSNDLFAGSGMGAKNAVATAATSPLFMNPGTSPGTSGNTLTGMPAATVRPLPRPVLLDVTPATLGIQTTGGFTEKLVAKNSPIPIERTRVFTTGRDDQTKVEIDCCRGESKRYDSNEPLGTLTLDDLPPRPRGVLQIEVTFQVDADGILNVAARDAKTGVQQTARLSVIGAPEIRPPSTTRAPLNAPGATRLGAKP